MTTTTRRIAAATAALALAASVAACSSGDDVATNTTQRVSDAPSNAGGNDAPGGLGDLPNMGAMGDCLAVAATYAQLWLVPAMAMGGITEDQLEEYQSDLSGLEGKVPDEIREDMETVTDAFTEFYEELGAVMKAGGGVCNPASAEASENASAAIEPDEVQAANDRITAYLDANCS